MKAYGATQISLHEANVSCGGRGTTAMAGQRRAGNAGRAAKSMDKKAHYPRHLAKAQMLEERQTGCAQSWACYLTVMTIAKHYSSCLQDSSVSLHNWQLQQRSSVPCLQVQNGRTCYVVLTFGSTTGHCPYSFCTIWATSHLATFCAAVHLFCLQCNTFVYILGQLANKS